MLNSIKEKIEGLFFGLSAVLGIISKYVFSLLHFLPLYIIGTPWWADVLIICASSFLFPYTVLLEPIIYIWAMIIVINSAFPLLIVVLFWILFGLWVIRFISYLTMIIRSFF